MTTRSKLFAAFGVLALFGILVPAASAMPGDQAHESEKMQDPITGPAEASETEHPMERMRGGMHHAGMMQDGDHAEAGQASPRMGGFSMEMPSQVPGFVTEIQKSIFSFLNDDITAQELSSSIQDSVPENETAE
ncbi:MAG: hypothetical protein MUP63_03300 [Candidatus Nanohaloarchaeota archaeon QJJ-7]|nr:hypothetical protein [Candidatus Nanohaloarchaeota archaeon QJJ-7]